MSDAIDMQIKPESINPLSLSLVRSKREIVEM